jgi:N-acetylglucosaminyldiphosphoundecaprenol N-acetyl-beta-D-mannosaminyltransferase
MMPEMIATMKVSALTKDGSPAPNGVFPALETVHVCGLPIHNVTLQDVLDRIDDRIARREPGFVVTPNVDHICRYHRDAHFRELYAKSFLVLADGTWVVWASHMTRRPIKAKISGSDLVLWLSEHAAIRGHSVFLFGAAEGVAEHAATLLQSKFPELRIAGTHCPPLGFEFDKHASRAAFEAVKSANPDICFLALGSPKQENWMHEHAVSAGIPVSLGIGAGLDFVTGRERRAPIIAQRLGLEWVWRLAQDPKRLAKRYFVDDALFFKLLARDVWRSATRRESA